MSQVVVTLQATLRRLGRAFALLGGMFWVVALVLALARLAFLHRANRVLCHPRNAQE